MKTKSFENARRSGRPSRLTAECKDYINDHLSDDDELTSRQTKIILQQNLQVSISESTVRRVLREQLE